MPRTLKFPYRFYAIEKQRYVSLYVRCVSESSCIFFLHELIKIKSIIYCSPFQTKLLVEIYSFKQVPVTP